MKFSFKKVGDTRMRKGTLTGFRRLPEMVLETPLLLLYSKSGSIPHITHEVLRLVTSEQLAVQQTLPSTYLMHDAVKEFRKGISDFVGLKECLTYFSIQDPAYKTPEGFNRKEEISVWTRTGRATLDSSRYMDVIETFQPDMYEVLSNGDTNLNSSKKKVAKVIESTRILYEDCLERHTSSNTLKYNSLLAVIEGGYDVEERKKCALSYADSPADGFVLNGFHSNGSEVEKISFDQVRKLVEVTTENLPERKLRILHGCWTPPTLLKLITLGLDIFDASYPYLVTERMSALAYEYEAVELEREVKDDIDSPLEISLTDTKYREDFSPISSACSCLTCIKHTRAYIHHLINNKELLASTLLMIHNLHHHMEFFKAIRNAFSRDQKIILK